MASPSTPKSQWSEYKNSEGRVYWSHSVTKQSVWEKPDELKTPFERALAKTQWKQYVSKDRPYYVNSATKETKWDLPAELQSLKKRVEEEEAYKVEKAKRKAEGLDSPTPPRSRSATPDDVRELRASAANANGMSMTTYNGPSSGTPTPYTQNRGRSESATPAPILQPIIMPPGGFLTHEKAEEGFIYLLKREGVDESWTWDQTMRTIIMDPLYKALGTLAEKKAAFEKHLQSIVNERRAAKEARIMRLRPIFHKMFASSPEIKSYSTMKTADKVFGRDRHWQEAQYDERRLLLEEYTDDLRQSEQSAERELRTRNIKVLTDLIKTLEISVSTRWRAAHDIIVSSDHFKADQDLLKIETIDILGVYDTYARQLEQEHEEESRKLRTEQVRQSRKARDGFKSLLNELSSQGELTRLTKWKEIYPKIKNDVRYEDLLGLQGSSPLDLYMDIIDDLNEEVERAAEKLERVLQKENKEIKLDTSWEQVEGWIKEAHVDNQIDEKVRKDVYSLIHSRLLQAAEDENRRNERRRRHRIDDLRYALKKVQRHIDLDMTYEEAEPHMKELKEFKEVDSDEDRKLAFEKFIKRQKEKLREAESSEVGSARDHEDRHRQDREREPSSRKEREREGKEKERRSSMREKEKDKMDVDDFSDAEKKGRERERERGSKRDDRDRESRHKYDRERERKHHSEVDDRDKDRDREYKRRKMSVSSSSARGGGAGGNKDEVEEGEI